LDITIAKKQNLKLNLLKKYANFDNLKRNNMPNSVVINPPTNHSLAPYSGAWTKVQAAHLLRRTLFGPNFTQLQSAITDGMDATIATLLTPKSIDLPLTYDSGETISAFGQPWNQSVYPTGTTGIQSVNTARLKSLGAWAMKRLNDQTTSISEKMCLFWHNHFAVPISVDQRSTLNYHQLVHLHSLGNFKQFIKEITLNPSMLEFQNGATNSVYSPNENYAREFLELFSIGKGPQIGAGDYSNYTEQDVAAGAKIFTGYTIQGIQSNTQTTVDTVYMDILHDNTTKQLSYHLNNAQISGANANEYANYIDIVFQQDEVARFISRKLYRYFVNNDITDLVESNIISAMAQIMITNNYDIKPVMEALLKSQHFYDANLIGSCIKSPTEMLFSVINSTNSTINYDLATNSDMYLQIYYLGDNLGQAYASPPSVSGWTAYYQAPSFTKLWANSTFIKNRMGIAYTFTMTSGLQVNGKYFKVNALGFLASLSNPSNVNNVVDDIITLLLPKPLDVIQRQTLKTILLGGQPDFEWTVQYNQYINNPGNPTFSNPIKQKVEQTLAQLFTLPHFQIF
jgi:uncharacterized protein (DUF1800 family)